MTRKTMEELTWTKERIMNEGVYGAFSNDKKSWKKGWCYLIEIGPKPFKILTKDDNYIGWFEYYRPIPEAKPLSQEYLAGKRICDMRIKAPDGSECSIMSIENESLNLSDESSRRFKVLKTLGFQISFDNGLTYQACEVCE